ncbi:MAG: amidohydrolase family protein [Flavobacteriaceae bacterium]|jgi:imidazolonepropionase-like amidohydrolase|nr:amidohydrolase family protein [Flavobacteriaceae bacterium]
MKPLLSLLLFIVSLMIQAQERTLVKADRLFDGVQLHYNWGVIVSGSQIEKVGPISELNSIEVNNTVSYPNSTISPGLIEGHSHLLLYPYNQTDWNTQVLKEADTYRAIRGVVHAENTLQAGFTTVRDLGSEGAGYADVDLKKAINDGIVPGPRMLVAGRAIVATGSYGPKGFDRDQELMLGAEASDGNDLIRTVRDQIGKGADVIKVYADYRWGPNGEAKPTFTLQELKLICEVAHSSGRSVVAHASSLEAIRRAIEAGVQTIEHGDELDRSTAQLMRERGVYFYPTLAAVESIESYRGWNKESQKETERLKKKKNSFSIALKEGVSIGMGGDVGVYPHGENALEMELMQEYGMKSLEVLKSTTSLNAKAFNLHNLGQLKEGFKADIIIVNGDPSKDIHQMRSVLWVMKEGKVYKD